MADLTGRSLGRYNLLGRLGEGGMAVVYKAFDTRLETEVAVKVIRTEKLTEESKERTLKRFNREAKLLARLTHPNIVSVTDFGEYEGMPYLVMPYLSGGTLKEQLGKPIAWNEAFRILTPIAHGLAYAHQRNIIHRDVKSSNILITDSGQPMLSDFGVAKILTIDDSMDLTNTGMGIGTPEYMAPEQWSGKASPQSDQYSLGVVLYEMLTGRKPYIAETPAAILLMQATDPLPSPNIFVSNIPDKVEKILIKTLALDPKKRYKNMRGLIKAIESCVKMNGFPSRWEKLLPVTKPMLDILANNNKLPGKQKNNSLFTGRHLNWQLVAIGTGLLAFIIMMSKTNIVANQFTVPLLFKPSVTILPNTPLPLTSTHGYTDTPIVVTDTIEPTSTPIPLTSTPVFEIGSTMISEKDGMVLVYVPAGKFTMGSNESLDEQPIHQIGLGAFWIDQTEVTNKMYARCVELGGCEVPKNLNSYFYDYYYGNVDFDNFPVVNVNWNMAKTYCEWGGRNLPAEAQWEKAARGPNGRTYPWGEGLTCDKVDFFNGTRMCQMGLSAVKNHPNGISPYGVYDMAGNVMEWVNSLYIPYPYKEDDGREGASDSGSRVFRGGSYYYFNTDLRSTNRGGDASSNSSADLGFRCAITLTK